MATIGDDFDTIWRKHANERESVRREATQAALNTVAVYENPPQRPQDALREELTAPPVPEDQPTEQEPQDDGGAGILGTLSDVIVRGIGGGLRDAATESLITLGTLTSPVELATALGAFGENAQAQQQAEHQTVREGLGGTAEPETLPGQIAKPIVQAASVFIPVGGQLRTAASGARLFAQMPNWLRAGMVSTGAGAITDFSAFDPNMAHLADFAEQYGITNAMTEALHSEEDDNIVESKLKTAIEGALLGVPADFVLGTTGRAIKQVKAWRTNRGFAKALAEEGVASAEMIAPIQTAGNQVIFLKQHLSDLRELSRLIDNAPEDLPPGLLERLQASDPAAAQEAAGRLRGLDLNARIESAERALSDAEEGYTQLLTNSKLPVEELERLKAGVDEFVPAHTEADTAAANEWRADNLETIRDLRKVEVPGAARPASAVPGRVFHGTTNPNLTHAGLDPARAVETPGVTFFTDSEDIAGQFTFPREYGEVITERPTGVFDEAGDEIFEEITPGPILEAKIDIRRPLYLSGEEAQRFIDDTAFQTETVARAKSLGHDGIIAQDVKEFAGEQRGNVYGVFNKSQIVDPNAALPPATAGPLTKQALFNRLEITEDIARGWRQAVRQGDWQGAAAALSDTWTGTNFERIAEPDGLKDLLAGITQETLRQRNTLRDPTVRTLAETEARAARLIAIETRDFGTAHDKVVDIINELIPGTADLDVKINAIRTLELSWLKRLDDLSGKIDGGMATALDEADFLRTATVLANLNDVRAGITGRIGRALGSLRINARGNEELGTALARYIDLHGGSDAILELANRVRATGGSKRATRALVNQAINKRGLLRKVIFEHFVNSILASPVTLSVNVLSNTAYGGLLLPAEELFTAGVTLNARRAQGVMRMYEGMYRGLKAAFIGTSAGRGLTLKAGKQLLRGKAGEAKALIADAEGVPSFFRSFATGDTITVPSSRQFDTGFDPAGAITSENLQRVVDAKGWLGKALAKKGAIAKMVDAVGTYERLPMRILTSFDEVAKAATYHARLSQLAFDRAIADGLDGSALRKRMDEIIDLVPRADNAPNLSPEQIKSLKAMDEAAQQYAAKATFTNELPIKSFGGSFQRLVSAHPGLRFIFPFIRTPVNLLKAAFEERTPLGLLIGETKGEIFQKKDPVAISRMMMGTTVGMMVYHWTQEGRITGTRSLDPRDNAALDLAGIQRSSIAFEDSEGKTFYVHYGRTDPIGAHIGLFADLAELSADMDEKEHADLVAGVIAIVSKSMTSKSYFQSLQDAVLAIHDPGRYGTRLLGRTASALLVPHSNFWAQVHRVQDENIPETDRRSLDLEFQSQVVSKLPPGVDDAVVQMINLINDKKKQLGIEPKLNIFGEEIVPPVGVPFSMLNPFFVSEGSQDPAAKEIARLRLPIDMVSMYSTLPGPGGGIKLSPAQMNRYIRLTAEPGHGSPTLRERLNKLITSKGYQEELSDGFVDHEYGEIKGGKAELVNDVLVKARSVARKIMLSENKDLRDQWNQLQVTAKMAKTNEGLRALANQGNEGAKNALTTRLQEALNLPTR